MCEGSCRVVPCAQGRAVCAGSCRMCRVEPYVQGRAVCAGLCRVCRVLPCAGSCRVQGRAVCRVVKCVQGCAVCDESCHVFQAWESVTSYHLAESTE